MSQPDLSVRVKWKDIEVDMMMQYIHQHQNDHWGEGGFRIAIFSVAAKHIKDYHVSGKRKDGKSVKTKFDQVRYIVFHHI